MAAILAAIHHNDATDAIAIVMVIIGIALILFGAYRAYLRDGIGALIAGLFGLVLLIIFWDNADL